MSDGPVRTETVMNELPSAILRAAERAGLGVSVSVVDDDVVRRVFVSPAAARILGYPVEELVGRPTFDTFSPEEAARMAELRRQWLGGEPLAQSIESEVMGKDGTRTPVEVAYSFLELDGRTATVALLRDITERRRAQHALQRSLGLFRQLIEAAPEAVSVVRDSRLVYANPRFLQLLGYAFDELGAMASIEELVHPEDRCTIPGRLAVILDAPSAPRAPSEFRLRTKSGSYVTTECSSMPIDFEGGIAVLTFLRDVTMRKEEQARLFQTDRMATIGTLAAGVAHEINNPLGYVTLNLEVLGREIDELVTTPSDRARVRERLRMVQEGAHHIATIVHDLRGFCRADSPPRPVDARQVLESAINMAMTEIGARARLVRDYTAVPPVLADSARLGQVLLNLLLNAAQSLTEDDGKAHEIRVTLEPEGSSHVRMAIADSGHGIAPEHMDRIFEPFFTTRAPGVGTGLGLSISRSIVHAMNGELTARSVLGQGSTFELRLPSSP
jgi:PAS domain S-box-containing protein